MRKWTVCSNVTQTSAPGLPELGEDNQFHLTGTTRILNTVSSFGSSGGLGEAAAWLCLREDIYISLISQRPLRTELHRFSNSDVFHREDDFAWASRMVFLLAKVLKYAFNYDRTVNPSRLEDIGKEIENWNARKPSTFQPIQYVPRSNEVHRKFPGVWMLLPVHGWSPARAFDNHANSQMCRSGWRSVLPYRSNHPRIFQSSQPVSGIRELQASAQHRG
ncbi:unnamed protein product [Aspergillus oryzae var. brunneus]|uniref:Unnamed protein product n=2 Tax=Aspergillus oryzae TaxID=5062 RepID=A0AAN5BXP3_ASPOZ|nr:unnamed protein product [Aspergillus oryzae]GMG50847.1 unnamed protein product [Aspergillus oryzae var. brunneus]